MLFQWISLAFLAMPVSYVSGMTWTEDSCLKLSKRFFALCRTKSLRKNKTRQRMSGRLFRGNTKFSRRWRWAASQQKCDEHHSTQKGKKEPITCFRLISCVIGFVVSGGNKATAEFERDAWNDSCIWYTPLWYHQQEGETRRQLFNFQIMCVQCEFLKSTVRDSQV